MKSKTRLILLSIVWAVDVVFLAVSMFLGAFAIVTLSMKINFCLLCQGALLIAVTVAWVNAFFEYRRESLSFDTDDEEE